MSVEKRYRDQYGHGLNNQVNVRVPGPSPAQSLSVELFGTQLITYESYVLQQSAGGARIICSTKREDVFSLFITPPLVSGVARFPSR